MHTQKIYTFSRIRKYRFNYNMVKEIISLHIMKY